MGLIEWGFSILEYTGNKLFEIYDVISSPPVSSEKKKKKIFRFESRGRNQLRIKETSNTKNQDKGTTKTVRAPTSQLPNSPGGEKITKLENELSKLRAEIAKFTTNIDFSSKKEDENVEQENFSEEVEFDSESYLFSVQSLPPVDPTLLESFTSYESPTGSPSIKKPSKPQELHSSAVGFVSKRSVSVSSSGSVSLADILNKSNTLRKVNVERSPGGTPRRVPVSPKEAVTSQDLIALALKKKFRQMNKMSPSPDTSAKSPLNSSWEEDKENISNLVVDKDNRIVHL